MTISEQNWTLLNSIHNEMDPPVEPEIANEIQPEPHGFKRVHYAHALDRPKHRQFKGEVQMKDWRAAEAEHRKCSETTICKDLAAGKYKNLITIRKVNSRVVYVRTN